ncbi:MAG: ABC transporter substrate-binding protein [Parasporobacterium sp.]|nr:ABC transporter substrate-binding protein [Parasporobacterium sp.]
MKKLKVMALICAAAMLAGLFAGCGQSQTDSEPAPAPAPAESTISVSGQAVSITDMSGREIVITEPAQRIVALTAADCEIIYALGAGDKLVGRGEYCNWPAEVLEVPSVESGMETNIEQILALKPDVLFMSAMAQSEEQVKQLEDAGIKVIVSDAPDIAGTYTAISMIGVVLGKEAEALSVINGMKAQFDEIQAKVTGDGTQTVYFEVSPLEWGLWAAGKGTFMDEIANMLGVKNIFGDVEGWAEVSEEQVIERNPDFIVTISMYYGEGPTPTEEILSRQGWDVITAVKNQAILNLQNDELSRPAPRLAEGAQLMYDFIYGEK